MTKPQEEMSPEMREMFDKVYLREPNDDPPKWWRPDAPPSGRRAELDE